MPDISREDIQQRVNDWIKRLKDLQLSVESWFSSAPEYVVTPMPPVVMNEQLMKQFNIPPHEMPCFELAKKGKTVALFKPNALYVIGANGRIDIFTAKGEAILVDMAEKFQTPQWKLFSEGNRGKGVPFDQEALQVLIDLT